MRRLLFLLAFLAPAAHAQVVGDLGAALDAFLTSQVEGGFSGAVLVASEGEIVLRKGYGFADRAASIPNTPETMFQIGSVAKPFTATAILALQDAGTLEVTDRLSDHIEGVPADKAAITLHHLLTHTAGLANAIGGDFEAIGREAYIREALATPLDRPPGTAYAYSNVGFALLAAIIEQVTGQSYDAYLQSLLRPVGMNHTGYRISDGELAHGYDGDRDLGLPMDRPWAEDGPYWNLRGNGGLLSTVDDLYRFHTALEDGEILSESARQLATTKHTDEGNNGRSHYGYGWALFPAPGGLLVTHNGGDGGWSADVLRFVDDDKVLIVLSNTADVEAFDVSMPLAQILFGQTPEPVMQSEMQDIPLEALADWPGGPRVLAFIETVNAGTPEAVQAFIETQVDASFQRNPDNVVRFFEAVADEVNHAPITLRSIRWDPDEGTFHGMAELADGRGYRLTIGVQPGEEHRIEGMGTEYADDLGSGEALDCAVELDDSLIEQRAAALLSAVCDGSEDARRQLVAEHVAPALVERQTADGLVTMLGRMHEDLGRAEVVGIELASDTEGTFILHAVDGPPLALKLILEAEAPHRIVGIGIDAASEGPSFGSLEEALDHIEAEAEAERFSGVVLVAQAGEPIVHRAFGWADRQREEPVALDTRFNLGSLNKVFTSVAVLQLAEQGRLELDAPIGTYLDGFPEAIADRVTVRHLLRHRSGWGHYWDHPVFLERQLELTEIGDYLAFIRTMPLDFEPGTRSQYSNVGFEVLGGIIEAVSGRSYHDYVREYVTGPAGMTDTEAFTRPAPRLATPYAGGEGYRQPVPETLVARGTAAGGGYGTALDLLRFQLALADGRLLARPSRNLLLSGFSSEADVDPGIGYAGGSPGVNGAWEWEGDLSVIVLANMAPPVAEILARALVDAAD